MKFIPKQLISLSAVGALTAASVFASAFPAQRARETQDRFVSEIETVLAMTPQQRDAARTAIQEARQSAQPIRQELTNTTKALKAAAKSDDTTQIQRLSTAEGQEIGKLVAIESSAAAEVYKTLTPEQKTKAHALHQLLLRDLRREMARANSRTGS